MFIKIIYYKSGVFCFSIKIENLVFCFLFFYKYAKFCFQFSIKIENLVFCFLFFYKKRKFCFLFFYINGKICFLFFYYSRLYLKMTPYSVLKPPTKLRTTTNNIKYNTKYNTKYKTKYNIILLFSFCRHSVIFTLFYGLL